MFLLITLFVASCSSSSDNFDDSSQIASISGLVDGKKVNITTKSNVSYLFKSEVVHLNSNGYKSTTLTLIMPISKDNSARGVKLTMSNPKEEKQIVKSSIIVPEYIGEKLIVNEVSNTIDVEIDITKLKLDEGNIRLDIEGAFSGSYNIRSSAQVLSLEDMNFKFTNLKMVVDL